MKCTYPVGTLNKKDCGGMMVFLKKENGWEYYQCKKCENIVRSKLIKKS